MKTHGPKTIKLFFMLDLVEHGIELLINIKIAYINGNVMVKS